ncbi:MAG TPA: M23 family metallopeptidase [Bacteroidaceae bacterium]|nr:M23 family metallopeptidase [Bacteroidaceae bacterium]
MAKKEKKVKQLFRKLTHQYRMVLLNESTFEEVGFVRLSRLNLIAFVGMLIIIVIILVSVLIAYTPLREYIPGYPDAAMRHNIRQNAMKLDSLESEIAIRDQYFENMRLIISGEEPENYLNDTTSAGIRNEIVFRRSNYDSILRERVEAEEQFRLKVFTNQSVNRELHEMHFFTPVRGMISRHFNPLDNHFGIDLVAGSDEVVKATLDGTVTMATWTLETGYILQIQHGHELISVYKHNAELFKNVGMKVKAGDAIAIVGNSGELTTGPHLHFELWHKGTPLDPADYVVF